MLEPCIQKVGVLDLGPFSKGAEDTLFEAPANFFTWRLNMKYGIAVCHTWVVPVGRQVVQFPYKAVGTCRPLLSSTILAAQ